MFVVEHVDLFIYYLFFFISGNMNMQPEYMLNTWKYAIPDVEYSRVVLFMAM